MTFKTNVELNKEEIEYRDHLIEELKSRTGASIVTISVYKENQELEPHTTRNHNIVEVRVGNQISRLVVSDEQLMHQRMPFYYAFKEASNRIMDVLIKAGAQALSSGKRSL